MTYEELKVEADKLGYNLIKKNQYIKFLPCTCGNNRRHLVYRIPCKEYPEGGDFYECTECGKSGPVGKSERDAKIKWNQMIEGEKSALQN